MNLKTHIYPLARDCRHITSYLRSNILPEKDAWGLDFYPCSATLQDGSILPCVCVYSLRDKITHSRKMTFERGLAACTESPYFWQSTNNQVRASFIKAVAKSRFALPAKIYSEFSAMGECKMDASWCNALMRDGNTIQLSCGGVISSFFDFPEPYSGGDIVSISRGDFSRSAIRAREHFEVYISWPEEEPTND
jgi:hypothetical protein